MSRTARAALLATVTALVTVTGVAIFLGFGVGPALIAGIVAGVAGGGLIAAAAGRAGHAMGDGAMPPTDPDRRDH